jgi:putative transcriptional regulator
MKKIEMQVRVQRRRLAKTIREERTLRGLSQGDLAIKAGIDRKTVNRIENQHFSPQLDTIVRLASALGYRPEELIGA